MNGYDEHLPSNKQLKKIKHWKNVLHLKMLTNNILILRRSVYSFIIVKIKKVLGEKICFNGEI